MTHFNPVSGPHLRQFIDRIERLEEEKQTLVKDIREVYAEAKSHGFDTKIMRKVVGLRKMKPDERNEHEELLMLYMNALNLSRSSSAGSTGERENRSSSNIPQTPAA